MRRGFTLIEIIITVVILGILAGLAAPSLHDAVVKADAAHVLSDFQVIRVAVMEYHAENDVYPKTRGQGRVPPELVSFLPDGFDFEYKSARYRWRRWSLPNGLPRNSRQTVLMGVEIRTTDPDLLAAIKNMMGSRTAYGSSKQVTLVIY